MLVRRGRDIGGYRVSPARLIALPATGPTAIVGQVVETGTALGVTPVKRLAVNQVIETDLAQAIVWSPKRRLVNQVTEVDLAQAITVIGGAVIVRPGTPETIVMVSQNLTSVYSR